MNNSYQDYIDFILDRFDFDRVQKVMEFLNWKWARAEFDVPQGHELRSEARRLLKEIWFLGNSQKADYSIATGGFSARFYWYNGDPMLSLSFVLEEQASEHV